MEKMHQAVRDFVSPFVIQSPIDKSQVIVGVSEESRFCYSVQIRCVLKSIIQDYGWDSAALTIDSQRITSIEHIQGRLWVGTSDCEESLVLSTDYTIYVQTTINNHTDFIWQALDLDTLEMYIVNEVTKTW